MNRFATVRILYKNIDRCTYAALSVAGMALIAYIMLVSMTIFQTAAYKHVMKETTTFRHEVAQLDLTHASLLNTVSLETARAQGYAVVATPLFITTSRTAAR
jgi:hypothetical protein